VISRRRKRQLNKWGYPRSLEVYMNKIISLILLVAGVALIIFGVQATNSFSSDVSRFFTGSPTDKAVWMLIGGVAAALIGLAGALRSKKAV